MIYEVRVASKSSQDPKGQDLLSEIRRTLGVKTIKNIRTAKIYRLEGVRPKDALTFAEKVLFEPINQQMSFNKPIFKNADCLLEIAYKPGVMNPEIESILKAANDLGISLEAADSSWEYAFFGKLSKEEIEMVVKRLLVNETIEKIITQKPQTLLISGKVGKVPKIPIRKLTDKQLMEFSKDRLFLNLEEMKVIQNYFVKIGRNPTDCEIEVLAQTWSEHCVHKTFKAKLIIDGHPKKPLIERIKSTIKNNPKIIISAFIDNSGVIDFYDGWAICGKVETHNSPSAIEPYGGAMTGSGGVFRDILGTGQGAKILASTDIFCFASPNLSPKLIPPGCLPPDYLLRKVVAGVRDYGNRVGIPTNNGSVHFHQDFRAKPTVAVGAYGIIAKKHSKKHWPKNGDLILTIGGRTGKDGIHGATFSSGEMTNKTISTLGASVQIGNAIEEKRMIDAILNLSKNGLLRTLTDCGAGGYSSAIGEMGAKIGARVFLEKVPLKYTGLSPWEIFLSESQERMILAISKQNLKKVLKVCKLYNVEATVIGQFDGSHRLKVTYQNQLVCDLDMQFLHHGLPQRVMRARTEHPNPQAGLGITRQARLGKRGGPRTQNEWQKIIEKIMAHGNVCSKEPIVRMYDHNVQGSNALHPFSGANLDGPNDGIIIKPILNKPYGLVISHGLNPVMSSVDPYWGSIWAIVEAVSNYVAIGGNIKDAALVDNFIWPFPDEESLADLDKAVDACVDMAKLLGMPFVSGKDSLSSTYRYKDGKVLKIPPVLLISVFGKIPDVSKTISADFKSIGSTIVLVGKPDIKNLGGTTYFDITKSISPKIPMPDLKSLPRVFDALTNAIQTGKVLSVHDISEGGLAGALAEMCFGGACGAFINLDALLSVALAKERPDFILFNETPATFLVEVANPQLAKKLFANVPHYIIGQTTQDPVIRLNQESIAICTLSVDQLKQSWQKPMKEIFH